MSSPARLHYERTLAAQAAAKAVPGTAGAPPVSGPAATAYEQMLLQLGEDRRRLHDIQSLEKKIELKRELFPNYAAWVGGAIDGARDSGRAVQDEIIVTMMVWAIDVGSFDAAIGIGEHVLKYRLALPERYKRTPACLLTEEIAEAALARLYKGEAFSITILLALEDLVDGEDMPDEVRAKLWKAIGLEAQRAADAEDPDDATRVAGFAAASRAHALAALQRALELNPQAGVKKNIDQLQRALKKEPALAGAASAPAAANDNGGQQTTETE